MVNGGFKCHACGEKGGDVLEFHRLRYRLGFIPAAKELGAWEKEVAFYPKRHETPQEAARRLAWYPLKQGFVPAALHVHRDVDRQPLWWSMRLKHPETSKKWIRPMHFDGDQYVLGEPLFTGSKPLYGQELIAPRSKEIVVVCEGESCADALRKQGVLAITSGCATSAPGADWALVTGRKVLIWPDHDDAGHKYASEVAEKITSLGCVVRTIDSAQLGVDKGGDAVDWLEIHPGAQRQEILNLPRIGETAPVSTVDVVRHPDIVATMRPAPQSLAQVDRESVLLWVAEHCISDSRAWGGTRPLYRHYRDRHMGTGITLDQFQEALCSMGLVVEKGLVHGLAIREDVTEWLESTSVSMSLPFNVVGTAA